MRRPLPLAPVLTALVLPALLVTGCAAGAPAGPPAARGDVAATVGDVTVPVSLVQDRVRTSVPDLRAAIEAQAAQGQAQGSGRLDAETLAARSRTLLTQSVLHELIAAQSRADGIVVTPADVDARLARAGGAQAVAEGSGYDAATVRELVGDQVAVAEIGRRVFDTLTVTVDYASVPDRASADALAARVVADPAGSAMATQPPTTSFTDSVLRPGTPQGGAQDGAQNGAAGQVAATSVLFGLPADSVTVTSAAPQSATGADQPDPATQPWSVVHVRRRAFDAGPPGAGVVPAALVDDQTMIEFGLRTLQPLAGRTGVSINPRFGTWDPTQLRVVAPPTAAGVVVPVAPVPASGPAVVPAPAAPAATLPAPAPAP